MTGLELTILAMPIIWVVLGVLAAWLHGRADDASRRADAEAERVEG